MIRELLDGPKPLVVLVAASYLSVPPGRGLRRFTRARPEAKRRSTQDHMIAKGQQWIVQDSIFMLCKTGTLRKYKEHNVVMVELTELGRFRHTV
jgi:hypothetical protein